MTASAKSRLFSRAACGVLVAAVQPCLADAPKAEIRYVSANDLAAKVATADGGSLAREVAADPSATTLIIRRDKTGEVEVHTLLNDIFVVESGHATVLVGGQVKGNHELELSEWRGGGIVGGERHELAAGDLLLIPAGVPHQCILKPGDTFIYLTIKTPSTRAVSTTH